MFFSQTLCLAGNGHFNFDSVGMGEMRSNGMLRCEGVWVCGCVVVDTEEESGGWGEPDDECGDNELITLIVTETTDKLVSVPFIT